MLEDASAQALFGGRRRVTLPLLSRFAPTTTEAESCYSTKQGKMLTVCCDVFFIFFIVIDYEERRVYPIANPSRVIRISLSFFHELQSEERLTEVLSITVIIEATAATENNNYSFPFWLAGQQSSIENNRHKSRWHDAHLCRPARLPRPPPPMPLFRQEASWLLGGNATSS